MTVYRWSQVADNNASIDSTINWVEGQAPSTINNSARAVMAAIAKLRDDISGKLVAGGTATAYTITSNQGFDTLPHMDGAMLSFKVTLTNGSPVTMQVDGLGAKPLRVSPGVELPTNTLVIGIPYGITYSNTDGAWYFQDGALAVSSTLAPSIVPIGGTVIWWSNTLPSANWLWCDGSSVTQAAYPALALVFGVGVGGTIVLPNLAETSPIGRRTMGAAANRNLISSVVPNNGNAAVLQTLLGEAAHTLSVAELAQHQHTGVLNNGAVSGSLNVDHSHNITAVFATTGGSVYGAAFGNPTGTAATAGVSGAQPTFAGGVADPNFSTSLIGSSSSHNIMTPHTVCNWIIRAI